MKIDFSTDLGVELLSLMVGTSPSLSPVCFILGFRPRGLINNIHYPLSGFHGYAQNYNI